MSKEAYVRYKQLMNQLEIDPEYLALEDERRTRERLFLAVIENLSEEQRAAVTDYIGICGELEQRMLEIACFAP